MKTSRLSRPVRTAAVLIAVVGAVALAGCTAAAGPADTQTASASAVTVADAAEGNTTTVTRLTSASALAAAEAALASCEAAGLGFVSVAVVDRFGQPQAILRGDNAAVHTLEAAQQKAYTSAAFGAPTSELAGRAAGDGPTIADLPGTLFLGGGVPIKAGEATIAGIGVGGAPSGDQDQSCAEAGAAVLAADLDS